MSGHTLLGYPVVIDDSVGANEIHLVKRRGRPPLSSHPSERVDIRVPRPIYDELCRAALRADVSLPEVVRQAIDRFLTVKNRQPK